MAWIESHQELEKHPKILRLSLAMNWSLDETIGKVHRFWWWCLDYAPIGDLRGVDALGMARGLHLTEDEATRFMPALMDAHFVCTIAIPPSYRGKIREKYANQPWRVHDWIEYAGRYLRDTKFKRRPEKWAQVVELYQETCQPTVSGLSATHSQPTVSRMSAVPNQPTNQTNQTNHSADRHVGDRGFEEFWNAYPRKQAKGAAERAWAKLRPDAQLRATILTAIQRAMTSADWTKDNGQFIPHPATWLNQKRWEDEPEQRRDVWAEFEAKHAAQ